MAQAEVGKNFRKKLKIFNSTIWCTMVHHGAPYGRVENFQFFSKIFSDFRLSHRALGMSDFDARGLIRQEIVSTFWILIKHRSQNDLHTCGTQKAHHAKNAFFVPVVCSSQCAWCAHILGGAHHLKVRHKSFPMLPPDLKSDKNSLL